MLFDLDAIGGHENIRLIFFDPPKDWVPLETKPMRIIWVLEAFPKKRDDLTEHDRRAEVKLLAPLAR